MPFTDDQYEEALREVYASAPTNDTPLPTLELRHSAFVDDDDNPTVIRIVADGQDLDAKLEATAPVDAGETVTFLACGFDITLPEQNSQALPQAQVKIDNAARTLVPHLDRAIDTHEPIEVTFREYLYSRRATGPSHLIRGLKGKQVTVTTFEVSGDVGFADLVNRRLPKRDFNQVDHRGIAG